MVAHCAGGQLHAVAYQIVLVGGEGEGIQLALFGFQKGFQPAGGHGEGIMAEFQLAALFADFIHGEIHDPAELIALPVHVLGRQGGQQLDEHAGGFLGGEQFARCQAHESVGRQVQGGNHLLADRLDEFGDTAHDLAFFVHAEPVYLFTGLYLHVGAELVDLLAGGGTIRDGYGFYALTLERTEAAAGEQFCSVGNGQVDAQVGFV